MTDTINHEQISDACTQVAVDAVNERLWLEKPDFGKIVLAKRLEHRQVVTSKGSSHVRVPHIDHATFTPYDTPAQTLLAMISGASIKTYACTVYSLFSTFGRDYSFKTVLDRNTSTDQRLVIIRTFISALFNAFCNYQTETDQAVCPRGIDFCLDEVESMEASSLGSTRSQQFVYFYHRDNRGTAETAAQLVSQCRDAIAQSALDENAKGTPCVLQYVSFYYWAIFCLIYGREGNTENCAFMNFLDCLHESMQEEAASTTDQLLIAYVGDAVEAMTRQCLVEVEDPEDGARLVPDREFINSVGDVLRFVESLPRDEWVTLVNDAPDST